MFSTNKTKSVVYIVQDICMKDLKPYIEVTPTEDCHCLGFFS